MPPKAKKGKAKSKSPKRAKSPKAKKAAAKKAKSKSPKRSKSPKKSPKPKKAAGVLTAISQAYDVKLKKKVAITKPQVIKYEDAKGTIRYQIKGISEESGIGLNVFANKVSAEAFAAKHKLKIKDDGKRAAKSPKRSAAKYKACVEACEKKKSPKRKAPAKKKKAAKEEESGDEAEEEADEE